MTGFDSTLVVETDAKREVRLSHTSQVILVGSVSAIQSSPYPKYMYTYDGDFTVYQLKPFRHVRKFEYNGDVGDFIVINDNMFVLSSDSIVLVGGASSRLIVGQFNNAKLSNVEGNLGVQGRDKLTIYCTSTLEILREYKCNTHYSIRDALITSYDNEVSLYRKGEKILGIFIPQRINRICTDPLLTDIYCGGSEGNIFCCSMNHREPKTMVYHKNEIVSMDLSFCGKYLYSADSSGVICVWDVKFNVVVAKTTLESPVIRMHVVYVSD